MICIPPPGERERKQIFQIHLRDKPLADDVDIGVLAKQTEGCVGADIEAICREAAMLALREFIRPDMDREKVKKDVKHKKINKRHLDMAIKERESESV